MSRKIGRAIVVSCLVVIISSVLYLEERDNFYPITSGEAYRSAQLDPEELKYYIMTYRIRSVLNLRGRREGERWYRDEVSTCRRLGVKHYDLHMAPDRSPSTEKVRALIKIFELAPRPILIHCRAGADRAGLAAAIWQVVIDDRPKSEARKQLDIRFGHIPLGPSRVLDRFFESWEWKEDVRIHRYGNCPRGRTVRICGNFSDDVS